jgi:hypothetical protein
MKQLEFSIKLLSDLIISSNSASEGFKPSLNYIPGAKFLGIAAGRLYDTESKETLDIFHNGNVRFGDAHLMGAESRSYKAPASWMFKKGEDFSHDIFLFHNLFLLNKNSNNEKTVQLKTIKDEQYFTPDGELLEIATAFSLKSAYNSQKKKSADQQMYGYHSLEKGTVWSFKVDFDYDEYMEKVCKAIVGIHRIGRSRSAEYGLMEIEKIAEVDTKEKVLPKGNLLLYAESNLCFYDQAGKNTICPDEDQLLLPKGSKIIQEKSKVNYRIYQSWNRKRHNRDADRLIIDKGSVFFIELSEELSDAVYLKAIGSHRAEGFGKILANPDFLVSETAMAPIKLVRKAPRKVTGSFAHQDSTRDGAYFDFIKARQDSFKAEFDVYAAVNEFIKMKGPSFRKISNNQWGQIRKIAKIALDDKVLNDLLFADETGFLMHGKSENDWRNNHKILKNALETYSFNGTKRDFVLLLSSEMAKK